MTPRELVDVHNTPGGKRVFGTDSQGFKDWRTDEDVVQTTEPREQEFSVPASTWDWNHGLGFRPLVEVHNTSREVVLAHITHIDENNVRVNFTYSATGYIIIR